MEVRRVVDVKSRLDDQSLVERQRSPALIVDVARQPQIGPSIEHEEELATRGGHVIAAERMARMVEVAHVAVPDAARERDRSHHLVANERAADVRVSAKLGEVPGRELCGNLHVVGRRLGQHVDRAADRVASIQGALWTTQDLDAIEVEKLHELHRRAREVDTVEKHRGARIEPALTTWCRYRGW